MKLTGLRLRSWAALETYAGDLGVLLGPMLAVLGRSWAYMGGLGPKSAKKMATLKMILNRERDLRPGDQY